MQKVILGTGHGTAVDWWAVGILLFEFLTGLYYYYCYFIKNFVDFFLSFHTGCPPFNDATPTKVFENVINGDISWPQGEGLKKYIVLQRKKVNCFYLFLK